MRAILYAPAIFIKSNNFKNNALIYLFSLWRNYINYSFIARFPTRIDGEENESLNHELAEYMSFNFIVLSSLKYLFKLDIESRYKLPLINQSYDIIMAVNDNRIDYSKVLSECEKSLNCKLHTFKEGYHYLNLANQRSNFVTKIVEIIKRDSLKN